MFFLKVLSFFLGQFSLEPNTQTHLKQCKISPQEDGEANGAFSTSGADSTS